METIVLTILILNLLAVFTIDAVRKRRKFLAEGEEPSE